MRTTTDILMILFLLIAAPLAIAVDEGTLPSKKIFDLHMQEGDDPAWRLRAFDSSDWPVAKRVKIRAFNEITLPEKVAWLRSAPLNIAPAFRRAPVALHVFSGASYQIYWNGILIGENGSPSDTPTEEEPGFVENHFYIPSEAIRAAGNVIAVRYSAHSYKKLSIPLTVSINVKAHRITDYDQLAGHIPAFLMIGAIGAAALFFGSLFVKRRDDRGALWLTIMFTMVTLQAVLETLLALTDLSFDWYAVRMLGIFVFSYGAGLALNLFVLTYFQLLKLRHFVLISANVAALAAVPFYFNNLNTLSHFTLALFVIAALSVTSYALSLKKRGAVALWLALTLFGLSFFVGYAMFLDSIYYVAMAILASTLLVLQANAFREADRQTSEAKLRLNRLELELLKRQLQPHFIMNTLTALSEWILTSPKASVDMIDALADEFRLLNAFSGEKLVSLTNELDLCHAHLKLMSYRQDQSYRLITEIEQADMQVPPAIFHTLIENALTHNRYSGTDGTFRLQQRTTGEGRIEFALTTPPAIQKRRERTQGKGGGVGLSYVKARLDEIWHTDFSFKDGTTGEHQWRTIISVPAKVPS